MATRGSGKPPRKSPMVTVADMASVQQDPGVGCASKTGKDGKTEGTVKAASESCTAIHGTEISPEGIRDQKTLGIGRFCKVAEVATRGSVRPPRKTLGTTNDVVLGNIKPLPEKVPVLLTVKAGSRGPRPQVSIPVSTTRGVLSQKQTESVGSPHRETLQTKVVTTLGRNKDNHPPPPGLPA